MRSKGFSLLETVVFIVLAALILPVFFFITQPVIKDMMTPTSYIKARFVAERKMEELMAHTFGATTLGVASPAYTVPCYADYTGYDCQLVITYFGCGAGGGSCVGYVDSPPILTTTTNPTKYKQIDVVVRGPQGIMYTAVSAIIARY